MRCCSRAVSRSRAASAKCCSIPRSTHRSAISRRSNSWCGPASPRARRSTPRCSRRRARRRPSLSSRPSERDEREPRPKNTESNLTRGPCISSMAVVRNSGLAAARRSGMTVRAMPASLQDFSGTLVLVGAGKMGGAMLEGWLALGLDPKKVAIVEPEPSPEIAALAARGARLNPPSARLMDASFLVMAVKPQAAADVAFQAKMFTTIGTTVISVMAGKTIKFLEGAFSFMTPIVRSIPNTPAAIGRGITVATANARVNEKQRAIANTLLGSIGAVEWVKDEGLIDAATAVSGSGPAYVFLLAESLARAGAAAGLPADLAARLASATVAGSGELLHQSPLDAATLRQNVTSPGGTTEAALAVLMDDDGLDRLMERAVAAATKRSRELAG